MDIVLETKGIELEIVPKEKFSRSKEYWIGWAAAYYQWYSNRKYSDIFKAVLFEDFEKIYYTLHEADVTKLADVVDEKVREYFNETNLRRFRTLYSYTQDTLSKLSGVSLRSIQMYEQRNKNINKAGAETVYCLARVLGCTVEDLLEK